MTGLDEKHIPRRNWFAIVLTGLFLHFPGMAEEMVSGTNFKVIQTIPLEATNTYSRRFVSLQSRRGTSLGILLLEPANPVASVILFAGGDGKIFINEDGTIDKDKNFLVRSRGLFAGQSLRTVVIQPPSDHTHFMTSRTSGWHMQDIATVVGYLKSLSAAPVWLVGTSRGTISVAAAANQIPDGLAGIVLTSSVTELNNHDSVYNTDVSGITLPVLVVHHVYDDCWVTPFSSAEVLIKDLKNAQPSELMSFTGGEGGSDECGPISNHGFNGIEFEVVSAISDWIKKTR